eukprot:TRINITY_DN3302_c0_g4_i3.p1 TRINITY_DN3302_c0_g4~~TRINITY_DN3302_c0_g4_i3.p1  ORF type:complete len:462 (-),score=115.48 TRINITY_DN3302_c0_g4_i3:16-1401(-)
MSTLETKLGVQIHNYNNEEDVLTEDEVLGRDFDWDQLARGYLSLDELNHLKKYDKIKGNSFSEKKSLFDKDGKTYCLIFMNLLTRFQKEDCLQYILTLIDQVLKNDPEKALLFYKLKDVERDVGIPDLPFGPLFSLLSRKNDWYIVSKTCTILATFLIEFPTVSQANIENTINAFIDQLKKQTDREKTVAVRALQTLLRKDKYRVLFARAGGLQMLIKLTKYTSPQTDSPEEQTNFQLLYQVLFCLWSLSFNKEVKSQMTSPELITNLSDILKNVDIVKVNRLSIAVLRSIVDLEKNTEVMIGCYLHKTLEHMKNRKWGDEDVESDISILMEKLELKYQDLSSFDVYKSELLSKKLDWTPSHKSERFWRDNCAKFEEDDFFAIRSLKDILATHKNPKVLSVACWDVGEFVRFHPRGKAIAQFLNIKSDVMKLLDHTDPDVKKEALLALQKLMVVHWEYVAQ